MCLPDLLAKTKRVLSRRSVSANVRTESGSIVSSRKVLFPSLASGKCKILLAARLEWPIVTKTTSSKPAGSIIAARVTTRAIKGPSCWGKSSQRKLLFKNSAWNSSAGQRERSLAHNLGRALVSKRSCNSRRKARCRSPGNIACVGSSKESPGNSANHDTTLVILTSPIFRLFTINGDTGRDAKSEDRFGNTARN